MLVAVFVIGVALSGYNAYKYQALNREVAKFHEGILTVTDNTSAKQVIKGFIANTYSEDLALSANAQTVFQALNIVGAVQNARRDTTVQTQLCNSWCEGKKVLGGFASFFGFSNDWGKNYQIEEQKRQATIQARTNTNTNPAPVTNSAPATNSQPSSQRTNANQNNNANPACDALCQTYQDAVASYLNSFDGFGQPTLSTQEIERRYQAALDACLAHYMKSMTAAAANNTCANDLSAPHSWVLD